jgi:signal transduction histidine kinase
MRRFRDRELAHDALLALAITVFAQIDLWLNVEQATHYGSDVVTALVTLVATSVLVLRRRAPLLTVCVVAGVIALPELVGQVTIQLWGDFLPLLIATYSVARYRSREVAFAGIGIAAVALLVVEFRVPVVGTASNIPFIWIPFAVVAATGLILRTRELTHDETVRAAVSEERARIARELHDVVAHSVSVMVVQAGAAEDLLDRDPERARIPLASVQETGGQAISELRRMLGLLRDESSTPTLAPQPGTNQLDDLVEQMAAVGLPVELRVEGTPRPLPPGVELAAYRVVQEALTNTLKHAGATRSTVVLRYCDEALDIEVVDDGDSSRSNGAGHGLIGMRERVTIYDGDFEAGRRSEGGFAVRVHLPLAKAWR